MKKERNIKKIIGEIILWSFILPIGFIIFKIFDAPVSNDLNVEGLRVKTDYILMLLQCLLGIIAVILPSVFAKRNKIEIPSNMYFVFLLFLYGAIFLGEVRNFYHTVPHWDTILHGFSSAMWGALGFSFINLLNNQEKFHLKMTPIFVAIFSFMFAITLGCVWEIYEFGCDYLFSTNMQKFVLSNGVELVGQAALMDTMKDLIVDSLGAIVMSVIGYISLKYKKGWVENLLIKRQA